MMSVGPAILWSPFYLGTRLVLGAGARGERAQAILYASVGVAGIFYATAGAWLIFGTCALLFPRRAAFWATLVVWLGGPAIYYSSVSPTYSHATSLFAVALFVYVWLRTRGVAATGGRSSSGRWLVSWLSSGGRIPSSCCCPSRRQSPRCGGARRASRP